jgi:hypothetical protein
MHESLSESSAGHGHVAVSLHAGKAILSSLSSAYPLKLLSPYIHDETALVYLMTYGGGLVGGDEIVVDVTVQLGARLLLLSQVCFPTASLQFIALTSWLGIHEGVQGPFRKTSRLFWTKC